MMTAESQINWTALEAVGALAAALVALGFALLREIRNWVLRPKLTIVPIESGPPDCVKVPTVRRRDGKVIAETDAYYLRMRVKNEGRRRAEQVEIFAAKLLRKQADGTSSEVESFLPMNLRWAHRGGVLPGLSPGMYRYGAIAAVFDPDKRAEFLPQDKEWPGVSPDKTLLSLSTETGTTARGYLQPFGTYQLELELAAENARPKTKKLQITLTGAWYDDERQMLSDGIGARLLE